ncbi:hypothetical protein DBV15_05889 [Temnothorax longispinosus]|uniref:Uncharacterized protein n=1 Tax=Temnothorax longispinosus TaxID=300112 RepID=A0A4S2KMR7_9HYME|nr:hypothetical protein DBV15_05889 [Temnothorax longispinosus]
MRYKEARVCVIRPTCALHLVRAWATNCGKLPRKSGNRTLGREVGLSNNYMLVDAIGTLDNGPEISCCRLQGTGGMSRRYHTATIHLGKPAYQWAINVLLFATSLAVEEDAEEVAGSSIIARNPLLFVHIISDANLHLVVHNWPILKHFHVTLQFSRFGDASEEEENVSNGKNVPQFIRLQRRQVHSMWRITDREVKHRLFEFRRRIPARLHSIINIIIVMSTVGNATSAFYESYICEDNAADCIAKHIRICARLNEKKSPSPEEVPFSHTARFWVTWK